jgi:opacity protein-like surface antigen
LAAAATAATAASAAAATAAAAAAAAAATTDEIEILEDRQNELYTTLSVMRAEISSMEEHNTKPGLPHHHHTTTTTSNHRLMRVWVR